MLPDKVTLEQIQALDGHTAREALLALLTEYDMEFEYTATLSGGGFITTAIEAARDWADGGPVYARLTLTGKWKRKE